jgi:hypothetical protein
VGAALVTGIALGTRPQNALPLALLIGAYLVDDVVHRRTLGVWAVGLAAGMLGVLGWLIPVAAASGGPRAYLELIADHARHVGRADSLFGAGVPLIEALRTRLIALGDTFLSSTLGMSLYSTLGTADLLRIAGLVVVVAVGLAAVDWRRRQRRWVAVWVAAATLQVFLFETLDRPRLLVPVIPPLALLVSVGWARIGPSSRAGTVAMICCTLGLMSRTVPLAAELHQVPAPPAQATAYIRDNYAPADTLVAAAGSFRAAQVELPAYPLIYLYEFDGAAAQAALQAERPYAAILDRDQFPPDSIAPLTGGADWVTLEDRTFSRSRLVHTQHDQVRLQILAPPTYIPAEALRLPEDGCIAVGDDAFGRYLGQGWYRPEDISGRSGRWAGTSLTATVRLNPGSMVAGELAIVALGYPESQTVSVRAGDRGLGTLDLTREWREARLPWTIDPAEEGAIVTIQLVHATVLSPKDATTGGSSDTRKLAAAYQRICVIPVP